MKLIRIMIVDDHKMVCEGLTRLIEFDEKVKVVETANDGIDCLNKIRRAKPDLVLLDMNMPEMNGIELLKILNQRKSRPKILVLTVHSEIEYLMKVLDLGVEGYILKDCGSKELLRSFGLPWRKVYTAKFDSNVKFQINCKRFRSGKNGVSVKKRA